MFFRSHLFHVLILSFKGFFFSIFSSGNHFVQQSRIILAILAKGHKRKIDVKLFWNQSPVVQSIVSLTSLLVVKMLTVLVSIISDSQVFLLKIFSKNISVYAIFNYQSFNATLTNNIVSFEQLGPGHYLRRRCLLKVFLFFLALATILYSHFSNFGWGHWWNTSVQIFWNQAIGQGRDVVWRFSIFFSSGSNLVQWSRTIAAILDFDRHNFILFQSRSHPVAKEQVSSQSDQRLIFKMAAVMAILDFLSAHLAILCLISTLMLIIKFWFNWIIEEMSKIWILNIFPI